MRLSIGIQHHPDRARLLPRLLGDLGDADVVSDPDPDAKLRAPWRTYRVALERTPPDATHRLIVQDDVEVCASFRPAVEAAIAAKPNALLVLCVCGNAVAAVARIYAAQKRGDAWIEFPYGQFVPALALVWPTPVIAPALAWVDEQPHRLFGYDDESGQGPAARARWYADDEIIGRIVRAIGVPVFATVPSLSHHPDVVASLAGKRAGYGLNSGRVTAAYIGRGDALAIDWGPAE